MSCAQVRDLLPLRPLDALEEDEESFVSGHLEGCLVCRERALAHDGAVDDLAAALAGPEHEPRAEQNTRVWAKVEAALAAGPALGKGALAAPAPAVPELAISLACAYCHDGLARAEACYCASCLAPHHEECFRAHGRCSAIGCEETLTVRPAGLAPVVVLEGKKAAPPSRLRRLLGTGLVAVVASSAAALATNGLRDRPAITAPPVASASPAAAPRTPPPVPASPAPTSPVPAYSGGARIDLAFADADVRAVVAAIGSAAGTNVLVEPGFDARLSIQVRQLPWREALDRVARSVGGEVHPLGDELLALVRSHLVTYGCRERDATLAIRDIARAAGRSVMVSPFCRGKPVTVELANERFVPALAATVRAAGLKVEARGQVLVVLPASGPEETTFTTEQLLRFQDDTEAFARIHRLPPAGDPRRFDFELEEDSDLRDVMDQIGRAAGRNIIVEPEIHARLSLSLRRVTWTDAVVAGCFLSSVRVEARGSILVLVRSPAARIAASHAPASDWLRLLSAYAGESFVAAPQLEDGSTDEITADLEACSWHDALDATVLAYGYARVEEKPGLWRISIDPEARAALKGK